MGYFTFVLSNIQALSEIDYVWLLADPEIIYIVTWTGQRENLKRIGRIINISEGTLLNGSYRKHASGISRPLTGEQNKPKTINQIEVYNASSKFYTCGFDWYSKRLR